LQGLASVFGRFYKKNQIFTTFSFTKPDKTRLTKQTKTHTWVLHLSIFWDIFVKNQSSSAKCRFISQGYVAENG